MNQSADDPIHVGVSGIPRGYHFPDPSGNWLQDHHRWQIQSVSPRVVIHEIPAGELEGSDLRGIEAVLAEGGNRVHYPGELDWADYKRLFTPELRWVQLCSTGFSDNVTPGVLDGSVTLTNAPGLHTLPIAESVLAAMLAHAKNFKQRRQDQTAHEWSQLKNDELTGRTVLIIGLGSIGTQVARLCRPFGMRVIGCRRRPVAVEAIDEVFTTADLLENLPRADYVVIAVPLTTETEHLICERHFSAMKKNAYLINVGRGKVTEESALLNAIRECQIAGAYLDAFEQEPLPEHHPLWDMENVFLVPHDSHSSPYIGDRMVDLFCENLALYVAGKDLRNVCDPKRGY